MNDDARTAWHEAGHAVAGYALGTPIDAVSVRSGSCYAGIALLRLPDVDVETIDVEAPTPILMPPKVRRALETRLWVSLAGEIGEEMREPRSGFLSRSDDEQVAQRLGVRLTGRSQEAVERAEAMPSIVSDWTAIDHTAAILAWHEATYYIAFARAATRRLLASYAPELRAVAEALLKTPVLSGRQVRGVIRSTTKGTPDASA